MTDPRPDPSSDMAGESEYGNDTGFATEATPTEGGDPGQGDTGGMTAEDDGAGDVDAQTDAAVSPDGPGAGAD